MKKLFAISFLAVYLFNVAGYQVLFHFVIRQSDQQFAQQLDRNQYGNEDLLQIKIPLNLPYYISQSAYERVTGEVNYKGVYYSYVKRKVTNDTLYILCLQNKDKTKLHGTQIDYEKKTSELPIQKGAGSSKKTISLSEHNPLPADYDLAAAVKTVHTFTPLWASPLPASLPDSNFQPPETAA